MTDIENYINEDFRVFVKPFLNKTKPKESNMTEDEFENKVKNIVEELESVIDEMRNSTMKCLLQRWLQDMHDIQEELFFVENKELDELLKRKTNWE